MTLALQLTALTTTFLLVGARVAGIVVSAPFFSSSYIPTMIRVAIIVFLSLILTPGLHADSALTGALLPLGMLIQFAVGTLMGLVLAVFQSLFGMAGQIITYQLGVGLAAESDPGLLSSGSFLSEWYTLLAVLVFVFAGGPELMVVALHASFQAISVNALIIPVSALSFVTGLFQTVLEVSLLIAAPLVVSGLIVNLSVGILSRAFPQINAYFLSLPINFGLSLLIFLVALPLMFTVMPTIWQQAWTDVSRLLVLLEGQGR